MRAESYAGLASLSYNEWTSAMASHSVTKKRGRAENEQRALRDEERESVGELRSARRASDERNDVETVNGRAGPQHIVAVIRVQNCCSPRSQI